MNKAIKANVKELSYVIQTTFGAPLDVRYLVSSLSKLSEELPLGLRYEGLLIYIQDISYFFYFHKGIEDVNCVPYNNIDIMTFDTVEHALAMPLSIRYRGLCVWITQTQQMYIFDTGTSNADLHPHNRIDIKTINSLDDIGQLPLSARFIGLPVWITSLNRLYIFKEGITNNDLKPYWQTDIVYVTNYADADQLHEQNRFIGQLVFVTSENAYYSYQGGILQSNLVPLRSQTILSLDTINHLATIPEHSRFVGQLIYIKDVNMLYVFTDGITDSDLRPIRKTDIKTIETPLQVSQLPQTSRFIGQLVWVVSNNRFWVFKDGIRDENLVPYNQTDVVSIPTYAGETGIQSLPTAERFIGQLVFVEDEKRFYTYAGGVTNNDVIPVADYSIVTLDSTDTLSETTLPARARYMGQLIYSIATKRFYSFKTNLFTLEPLSTSNVVIVSSSASLDTELPVSERFIGQLVHILDIKFTGIYTTNTQTLVPLATNSDILVLQQNSDIADVPSFKRFIGQLVYVRSERIFYYFKTGITDEDLVPYWQQDVQTIPSYSQDTSLASERFIGQLVYAQDVKAFYKRIGLQNNEKVLVNQIDVCSVVSKGGAWSTQLPRDLRFQGQLVYGQTEKVHYTFEGGTDDANLVPLRASNIVVVDAYTDIATKPLYTRYVGQLYYVRGLNMLFGYKNSTANDDLEPICGIDIVTVFDKPTLDDLPEERRFIGQLGYVQSTKIMYQCIQDSTNKLVYVPFNRLDIVSVVTQTELYSIPSENRYPGKLGYVQNDDAYFMFDIDGNPKPLRTTSILLVKTWADAEAIPTYLRYAGQQVYVDIENRLYTFKGGTLNSHLVPVENTLYCSSLSKLDVEIPVHARQRGQLVWIADLQQLRVFSSTTTLLHIRDEVQQVEQTADLDALKDVEKRPYIVLDKETKATRVWRDTSKRYVPISSESIVVGNTVESLLASLSTDVHDEERVIGKLYYISSLGVHYTFIDGIEDVNFRAIESHYIVQSILDIETVIPPERRYVGMQFYVVDEAIWYYFQDINTYKKQQGFTQFQDKLFISGDFEYAHNKNVNAIIMEVRNEDNEVIDIPYRMGYLNESGKTDLEKAYGRRNIISLSTDIPGMYTLYMLAL